MHSLEEKLIQLWPLSRWRGVTLALAISGGADSVALLRAVHRLRPDSTRLVVAHFNHGLRGEESDGDASFVQSLSQHLGASFHCNALSFDQQANDGIDHSCLQDEGALRERRYAFLSQTAAHEGARYLVTAHTSDDQAETILFQLFRGTGAMAGIRPFRPLPKIPDIVLARPLLQVSRNEVEDYLDLLKQEFRHDRSNDGVDYARNWIRHELLPLIDERFPHARTAISKSAIASLDLTEWIDSQAQRLQEFAFRRTPSGGLEIDVSKSVTAPWFVCIAAVKDHWHREGWPLVDMSQVHWNWIRSALEQTEPSGSWNLPGNVRMIRRTESLALERHQPPC